MILAAKKNHLVCDFQPPGAMMVRETGQKGLALQHLGQVLPQQNGREVSGTS